MTCDLPCVSHMALYIISLHIIHGNSRSSTHWKLSEGKVVDNSNSKDGDESEDDRLMGILTTKTPLEDRGWRVDQPILHRKQSGDKMKTCNGIHTGNRKNSCTSKQHKPPENKKTLSKVRLTCGKPVNATKYDHLRGIANREEHPHVPEPEVALIFTQNGGTGQVDLNSLEGKLRQTKKQSPNSVQVYNQIGNFWRIKGNTQLSIECFRKALSMSPDHPDVLLNLARVLFNLQFLEDAIYLTRQSLEMQSPDKNNWLQHFTLGEILKAYRHNHEASLHFRHALKLKPGFQPAEAHLRDMEGLPSQSVSQYTVFIILFLVLGVLFGVVTSVEANFEDNESSKTQRHFNRAMAMRSIKLGINPKLIRMRKYNT